MLNLGNQPQLRPILGKKERQFLLLLGWVFIETETQIRFERKALNFVCNWVWVSNETGLRKINGIQTNFEWKTLYFVCNWVWVFIEMGLRKCLKFRPILYEKHHIFSVIGSEFLLKSVWESASEIQTYIV